MSERVRVLTRADGQLVARKVVTPSSRRTHEIHLLRTARHPGVVQVAEGAAATAEDDDTLDTIWAGSHSLETHAALTPSQAAGTLASLATTVADLHQAGITHQRIGTSHVLIGRDGRPVLCGFGDAQLAPRLDDPAHELRVAEDVEALGQLLRTLVQQDPSARSRPLDRARSQRRALLALADRACHEDRARRPSARAFAAAVIEIVPAADLPADAPPADALPVNDVPVADGEVVDVSPTTSPGESTASGRVDRPAEPAVAADAANAAATSDPFDRLRRSATEPVPRRTVVSRRRVGLVVTALLVVVAGLLAPRAWSSHSNQTADTTLIRAAGPPATTEETSVPHPTGTARSAPTETPHGTESIAGTLTDACPATRLETANLAADIDGDRCPDAVLIDGNTVTVGDRQWKIGEAGDAITIADWDCDGTATPALLRRPTGEIFVFDAWAEPGEEVAVQTISTIPDAALIAPTPDVDCPDVVVTRRDGGSVSVPASHPSSQPSED